MIDIFRKNRTNVKSIIIEDEERYKTGILKRLVNMTN